MSQPAQNQQDTKPSTTPNPNPPQPNKEPDAFAELAEALVSAQAYLNNPKAEKTSTRRAPVHLVPDPNALLCESGRNLPRAESREPRQEAHDEKSVPASSSLLPQAALENSAHRGPLRAEDASPGGAPCGSGLQPRQKARVVSASSRARKNGASQVDGESSLGDQSGRGPSFGLRSSPSDSETGALSPTSPLATGSRGTATHQKDAASAASLLPQAAVDPPARSAVSSSRATIRRPRTPRASSVRQAKNYFRAGKVPKRHLLGSVPDLQRHRRKCAICNHPEREMIEELFIHWHSPAAIVNFLRDYDEINWVSIYRHAYAFGLDTIRRRNLHHFFENLLDDAIEATPTFSGVLGAARALGCVTEDGRWVEPEKRILMTTLVRHDDPQATSTTDPDSVVSKSEGCGREPFTSLPKAAVDQSVRSTGQFGSPAAGREPQNVPSTLLPQAAFHNPAAASQTPPSGQPSAARKNESVAAPASSLPEAAFDNPAAASQTPPSGSPNAARRNESVAASATILPEAASHKPAAAKRTPPGSPEIRLSPNSHETKQKTISNR